MPVNLKGYNAGMYLEDSRFRKYIFVAVGDENISLLLSVERRDEPFGWWVSSVVAVGEVKDERIE